MPAHRFCVDACYERLGLPASRIGSRQKPFYIRFRFAPQNARCLRLCPFRPFVGVSMGMQAWKDHWQEVYDNIRLHFLSLGPRYCQEQKDYALSLIDQYGVRATVRILRIPRRTLQRWCRASCKCVPRCPGWVYSWAARRRKRRESWIWDDSGQQGARLSLSPLKKPLESSKSQFPKLGEIAKT